MAMAHDSFWTGFGRDRERRRPADGPPAAADWRDTRPTVTRADGEAEAARRQLHLDARLAGLTGVLRAVLTSPVPAIAELAAHAPAAGPAPQPEQPPRWADFVPREPRFFGRSAHARREAAAHARFDAAFAAFDRRRTEARDQRAAQEVEQREEYVRRVDALLTAARHGNPDAPPELAAAVLDAVVPLRGLVRGGRGVYQPVGRELTVEVDLPGPDVVPVEERWRYVPDRRVLEAVHRTPADRATVYARLVGQAALAVLSACFRAFPAEVVDTVTVNGHADGMDPVGGTRTRPCLVTVTAARSTFDRLGPDGPEVDVVECLRFLGADGSQHPSALWPVRPYVDVDRLLRYRDATAGGPDRADLMAMDAHAFEGLLAALFRAKGFDVWHTRSTRDDGVEAVVGRSDPYVPGECLVQVRRVRDVVPPADVQALMRAVAAHPTATNGVLATTSRFGDRTRQQARARGIVAMEGAELGLQIREHLGLDVVNSALAA